MSRHKHECVECFDPKTLDLIRCVCSLERLVDDVFKCLSCRPSTRRLQQILTCVLLDEVRQIENLLTNETFGLAEIKSEIRQIENTVQTINNILTADLAFISGEIQAVNNSLNNPAFGLQRIENDIQSVNNSVNNPAFGLRKIETDIQAVNNSVSSPAFGLQRIENDIQGVKSILNDPAVGLQRIETGIQAINSSVSSPAFGLQRIETDIQALKSILNNPAFGLQEIKTEIQDILSNINSPLFGLQEIENEIQDINKNINNPIFGLQEIRDEIQDVISSINSPMFGLQEIESQMRTVGNSVVGIYPRLTTGPVFINENARHLTVQVQNNTSTPHTVSVRVMRIDKKPFQEIFNKSLEISPMSTNEFRYIGLDSADCCDSTSGEFEVILGDLEAGLYPTIAQLDEDDKIITSSIFKSADFIPKTEDHV